MVTAATPIKDIQNLSQAIQMLILLGHTVKHILGIKIVEIQVLIKATSSVKVVDNKDINGIICLTR